mmetsp:Transcript_59994/g.159617  ORF Transcript_59994/g.159617 Transcript_59994/m.159617 type:complete len:105 (-) Transcript_59994:773-1087(-)
MTGRTRGGTAPLTIKREEEEGRVLMTITKEKEGGEAPMMIEREEEVRKRVPTIRIEEGTVPTTIRTSSGLTGRELPLMIVVSAAEGKGLMIRDGEEKVRTTTTG